MSMFTTFGMCCKPDMYDLHVCANHFRFGGTDFCRSNSNASGKDTCMYTTIGLQHMTRRSQTVTLEKAEGISGKIVRCQTDELASPHHAQDT